MQIKNYQKAYLHAGVEAVGPIIIVHSFGKVNVLKGEDPPHTREK